MKIFVSKIIQNLSSKLTKIRVFKNFQSHSYQLIQIYIIAFTLSFLSSHHISIKLYQTASISTKPLLPNHPPDSKSLLPLSKSPSGERGHREKEKKKRIAIKTKSIKTTQIHYSHYYHLTIGEKEGKEKRKSTENPACPRFLGRESGNPPRWRLTSPHVW